MPKLQIAKFGNYKTFPLFIYTTKADIFPKLFELTAQKAKQYLVLLQQFRVRKNFVTEQYRVRKNFF